MKRLIGWGLRAVVAAAGAFALSGCATTLPDRYARAYDACDRQAGACYESCEVTGGQRLARCQDDCSRTVDQCFARVSRAMERDSYGLSNSYAFYGRHGYWSRGYGWRYGRHGRAYSYDPYGYYDPYYRERRPRGARYGGRYGSGWDDRDDRRDRDGDGDRDRDRDNEGYVYGDDGSVRDRDGRVLRPAGRPGRADPTRGDRTNGTQPGTRSSDPTVRPARPTRPPATQPARPRPPRAPKPASPSRDKGKRQEP